MRTHSSMQGRATERRSSHLRERCAWAVACILTLTAGSPVQAQVRYLSMQGTDSGSCISSPCRSPEYAVSRLQPGDTLYVRSGTYVLRSELAPAADGLPKAKTVVKAFPGDERPIFDGRNILVDETWTRVRGTDVWWTDWQDEWTVEQVSKNGRGRLDIGDVTYYRETFVVDGDRKDGSPDALPLLYWGPCQPGYTGVPSRMPTGRLCVIDDDPYHGSPSRIYVHLRDSGDPNQKTIRVSTLGCHFNCQSDGQLARNSNLHVEGLHLKYAASGNGGIIILGPGSGGGHVIRNNIIELGTQNGISVGGSGNLIEDNIVRWNGRGNIGGNNMRESLIQRNVSGVRNWKGFWCGNGCGDKYINGRDNVIRWNRILSPGPFNAHASSGGGKAAFSKSEPGNEYQADGIWMDVDFDDNLVYGNWIEGSWRTGIFNEISRGNRIVGNIIKGVVAQSRSDNNRQAINCAGCKDALVAHNTVIGSHGCYKVQTYARPKSFYNISENNLFVNNACIGNDWKGAGQTGATHVNVTRRPKLDDKGMTDEALASNRSDGNAYASADPNAAFFRYQTSRGQRLFKLTEMSRWAALTGNDRRSFVAPVAAVGSDGRPAAGSPLIGRAIPIPDAFLSKGVIFTDFYGTSIPVNGGGTVGAVQWTGREPEAGTQ